MVSRACLLSEGDSLFSLKVSLFSQGYPSKAFAGFSCSASLKGVWLMTLFPQTDCCSLLGIDPKTLRNWLRDAHMPFATHPSDARLKCLTQAQVQQLAALHGPYKYRFFGKEG